MAIGIMVGCMPAVAALTRNRGLTVSHTFATLHAFCETIQVSSWSWFQRNSKIRSWIYFNKTSSENGDSTLRDQRKRSSKRQSEGYIELMEARQPRT